MSFSMCREPLGRHEEKSLPCRESGKEEEGKAAMDGEAIEAKGEVLGLGSQVSVLPPSWAQVGTEAGVFGCQHRGMLSLQSMGLML